MHARRGPSLLALLLVGFIHSPASHAADLFWNPGGTGGNGIWGTGPGDKNWNPTPGAPTGNTFWPNSLNEVAAFQDNLGGIVTVFDPVEAAGIRQAGADYILNAGTITLVPDASNTAPFIRVANGTLTVDSRLDGTNGLTKTGDGDLVLSGASTYTGTTALDHGALTLTGSLASGEVRIAARTTLRNESGGFSDSTDLTNHGGLVLAAPETVRSYVHSGGLVGPGSLTVTEGATLQGGSVEGTLLGDITVTRDRVHISGTTGGDTLTVRRGALLYVDGSINNATVDVQGGGLDLLRDSIADTSDLFVRQDGHVHLIGDDTVRAATISGRLYGGRILTASTYHLRDGAVIDARLGEGVLDLAPGFQGSVAVNGTLAMDDVHLRSGTLVLSGDNIDDTSALRADSLSLIRLNGPETVDTFSLAQAELSGPGALTVANGATLGGASTVSGNLLGDITVDAIRNGPADVSGTIGGGRLTVSEGTLALTGISTNIPVGILAPGILVDEGDLADLAVVTNAGRLTMRLDDTIGSYTSHGGILDGVGILTAVDGAALHEGSHIAGALRGATSTTGGVLLGGSLGGGPLTIADGTLKVTGKILGDPVTIQPGAALVDQGDMALAATGRIRNHGTLALDGPETVASYDSSPGAVTQIKIDGPGASDHLTADTVTLEPGSTLLLERSELLFGQVADIIDGAIDGTFTMIEALAGAGRDLRYGFNPNDGTLQALPGTVYPASNPQARLFNLTGNQTRVIGTVFDDTHLDPEPGPGGNFRRIYYRDTGDPDPDRRWSEIPPSQARLGDTFLHDLDPGRGRVPVEPGSQAALLDDAITAFQSNYETLRDGDGLTVLDPRGQAIPVVGPRGLAVANALSPEVHQGMADFTRQAMRTQMRTAMRTTTGVAAGKGHVFAAFHRADAGSRDADNGASYDLDMPGGVAGMRHRYSDRLQLGAMIGTVNGDIDGSLVDTDGQGFMLGVFGEYLLDPEHRTTVFSSLSLGAFSYDATRRSFGGPVYANNIDSHALELALGFETVAWRNDRFRLVPRGAIRYLDGHVDGFTETGPGVRMKVDSIDIASCLLELGLDAEFDFNAATTLHSHLGVMTDLYGSGETVSGSYLGGGLPVRVTAPGVDGEAFTLGLGASFTVNETTRLDLNWRSEFREGSQDTHLLSLGGRVSF